MRIRIALVVTVGLLTAVPAEGARDLFVRDSPRSAVATCLRPTGTPGLVGMLGPLERRMSPYDLLRVSRGGVTVAATARLGTLDDCPAVAADPSGHAIVAGAVRGRRGGAIRAALAEPGGGFGAPLHISRVRTLPLGAAAAISPRGDAVVAWSLMRPVRGRGAADARTRVVAALRPAGGGFGPPRFLTPWRRASFLPRATVSAAMDASGTATVAWAQPIPDRGNIPALSRVEVAAAPPGGSFGPAQVLARRVQDVNRVALAVAPDGRALLAHDGQGAIELHERVAAGSEFAAVRRLRSRRDAWERPEVAVGPDGSAVVAWRGDEARGSEDVLAVSRRGNGAWTEPVAIQRSREDDSSVAEVYAIFIGSSGRPTPPDDSGNTALRAAIAPGGRYLLSWGVERRLPFGDSPLAARMAQGQAGGGASRPDTAGCRCRSVNGVVPLELAGGELLLAYTDNATSVFDFGLEFPTRSGRLHLAEAGPPGLAPEPLRLRVRRPPPTTLAYGNMLRVRVGCDRPCDLRAYVVGEGGRGRGVASGTLARAGTTALAIKPSLERHLAPPQGGSARIVVHGYTANGSTRVTRAVPVELRRRPLRPLPRLLDLRAVRRGRSIVVSWRTDRPARRVRFEAVQQLSRRRGVPMEPEYLLGRGRQRFRVRLAGPADAVGVSVIRNWPPYDRRTVVVQVAG